LNKSAGQFTFGTGATWSIKVVGMALCSLSETGGPLNRCLDLSRRRPTARRKMTQ
jgi:hypothetical protein